VDLVAPITFDTPTLGDGFYATDNEPEPTYTGEQCLALALLAHAVQTLTGPINDDTTLYDQECDYVWLFLADDDAPCSATWCCHILNRDLSKLRKYHTFNPFVLSAASRVRTTGLPFYTLPLNQGRRPRRRTI